ncbi:Uncharacterised protein [Mycobacterium tuberculosis]|nr:Uncharacterised protein [Mycobacterium tuberculosis]
MALFAAQFWSLAFGCCGDLATDVAAEEIAYASALAQALDHSVETTL